MEPMHRYVPGGPSVEELRARCAMERGALVRQAMGWGAIVACAIVYSLYTFVSAQDAARSGSGDTRYWILWGPIVFGTYRAIKAALGAARLADEARHLR